MKRLEDIVNEYSKLYVEEIYFNEKTSELEITLFNDEYDNHDNFINDCNNIKDELEMLGYDCTYDDDLAENYYEIYILI